MPPDGAAPRARTEAAENGPRYAVFVCVLVACGTRIRPCPLPNSLARRVLRSETPSAKRGWRHARRTGSGSDRQKQVAAEGEKDQHVAVCHRVTPTRQPRRRLASARPSKRFQIQRSLKPRRRTRISRKDGGGSRQLFARQGTSDSSGGVLANGEDGLCSFDPE